MADNVSMLRGRVGPKCTTAGEVAAWAVSGIPNVYGSSYGDTYSAFASVAEISKPRKSDEEKGSTAGEAPAWDISGVPRALPAVYQSWAMPWSVPGETSRLRSSVELKVEPAGEVPEWDASGTPKSRVPSYADRDYSFNSIGEVSLQNRTPNPQLPIGGGGKVVTYALRARDSSLPLTDPTRYVYWVSMSVTLESFPGPLPGTGPLVDLVILSAR